MTEYPKPQKGAHKAAKEAQKSELLEYRRAQAALAIERDGDRCAICWFVHHRVRSRDDVHHVYGRGIRAGDWRENYTNLLCVCREHHPPPIKTPGANESLAWVEVVLAQANRNFPRGNCGIQDQPLAGNPASSTGAVRSQPLESDLRPE